MITNGVLFFIARDIMPLSVVEGEGFQYMTKVLNPHYPIPSRKKISTLLDSKYDVIKTVYINKLTKALDCSITCDVWTDVEKQSYLGVSVHFVDKIDTLESGFLGVFPLTERSTSEHLKECLQNVLTDFQLQKEKVTLCATDGGANIVKTAKEVFGKDKHLVCFAHKLSHVIPDALHDSQDLERIISEVKIIVTYVRKSTVAKAELFKLQKNDGVEPLNLIQDIHTRWTAKKEMIERFIQLEKYMYGATRTCRNAPNMLQRSDLNILIDVLPIMNVVTDTITELSGEDYPTCSLIIPAVNCLKETINKMCLVTALAKDFQVKVLHHLDQRLGSYEDNIICGVSTILDPRFKKVHFKKHECASKAVNYINNLLQESENKASEIPKKITPLRNSNCIWRHHQDLSDVIEIDRSDNSANSSLNIELKEYLTQKRIPLDISSLKFWEDKKFEFPALHVIGRKYASLVGTTVPSERIFSRAGLIKTKIRNKLLGERLNKLVFLSSIDTKYWGL